MPFNFELTISGLCVVVLKAKVAKPLEPTAVDILCVGAHYHRPRLSYLPEYVKPAQKLEPDLCVDSTGGRIASLNASGLALKLYLDSEATKFGVKWGEDPNRETPNVLAEEDWMHWVPSAGDLGLSKIRIGKPGQLDHGISARMSLPPGDISARRVVKTKDDKYGVWEFSGSGKKRALANEVVYSARNVKYASIAWDNDSQKIEYSRDADLKMCFSNDMEVVPSSYTADHKTLHHLSHLVVLADPPTKVEIPKLAGYQRTGKPICNQVFFVDYTD